MPYATYANAIVGSWLSCHAGDTEASYLATKLVLATLASVLGRCLVYLVVLPHVNCSCVSQSDFSLGR